MFRARYAKKVPRRFLGHSQDHRHHRPAVDPLFRSAARAYGMGVVGVVLTGNLDCGTVGLMVIKARGGVTVVQDPNEVLCPDMPRHALAHVNIDHVARLSEMAPLLTRLATEPAAESTTLPWSALEPASIRRPSPRMSRTVENRIEGVVITFFDVSPRPADAPPGGRARGGAP